MFISDSYKSYTLTPQENREVENSYFQHKVFARRHFQMAQEADRSWSSSLGHKLIGLAEGCPLLGALIAKIELFLFYWYTKKLRSQEGTPGILLKGSLPQMPAPSAIALSKDPKMPEGLKQHDFVDDRSSCHKASFIALLGAKDWENVERQVCSTDLTHACIKNALEWLYAVEGEERSTRSYYVNRLVIVPLFKIEGFDFNPVLDQIWNGFHCYEEDDGFRGVPLLREYIRDLIMNKKIDQIKEALSYFSEKEDNESILEVFRAMFATKWLTPSQIVALLDWSAASIDVDFNQPCRWADGGLEFILATFIRREMGLYPLSPKIEIARRLGAMGACLDAAAEGVLSPRAQWLKVVKPANCSLQNYLEEQNNRIDFDDEASSFLIEERRGLSRIEIIEVAKQWLGMASMIRKENSWARRRDAVAVMSLRHHAAMRIGLPAAE